MCQLCPPPPALQQEPRVCLRDRLLPTRLCLHPVGIQGEGEGHPGLPHPHCRRWQETPSTSPSSSPVTGGGRGSPRRVAGQPGAVPDACVAVLYVARSSPGLAVPGCPMGTGPGSGSPLEGPARCRPEHTSFLPTLLHMPGLFPASPRADISPLALAGSRGSPHAVGDPLLGIGTRTVPVQPP